MFYVDEVSFRHTCSYGLTAPFLLSIVLSYHTTSLNNNRPALLDLDPLMLELTCESYVGESQH